MAHPFEFSSRTEKSLCWRLERKMLHFTAMSIHYRIHRNNNTDLNISRIQLQILSIHGKDINTFKKCMYTFSFCQAWFLEEEGKLKKTKNCSHDEIHFCEKEEFDENLKKCTKINFHAQIIFIEYFIVAWVETWVEF